MTPERRVRERQRVEEADHALTNDLLGGTVESVATTAATTATTTTTATLSSTAAGAAPPPPLKDMKDHLKYARTVATALAKHGQIHWRTAFYKEALSQSTAVLDEDAISELIKMLNVMKNDKVAAQKRKVKGQAQKSKKVDNSKPLATMTPTTSTIPLARTTFLTRGSACVRVSVVVVVVVVALAV
jgi:Translation initiation factor eIF3 subunit